MVTWDKDEQKVSEMRLGFSVTILLIWIRVTIVNIVSFVVASRSIRNYSFGSIIF